ncbi:MAG TPA: ROK family transcriptional regulator [Clostridia bacterium]|nr:ROK family transcriptional regulator [Clostridia bacterium]
MNIKIGNPKFMKSWNRKIITNILSKDSPISQTQICQKTGLSKATVSTIINELKEEDLVIEVGKNDSKGGRRQILLELNGDAGFVVGVDLGGTKMAGAVANLNGDFQARLYWPTETENGPEEVLKNLIHFIKKLIKKSNVSERKIRGIGVGVPGILDSKGKVDWAPALNWRKLDLADKLSKALDNPVFIENDVNLLTLGEYWYGAGQDVDSMACLAVGTGIGAGLIINGVLHTGAHNAAGEVCNLVVDRSLLAKDFSQFGNLEMIASGPALARIYKEKLLDSNTESDDLYTPRNLDLPENHDINLSGAEEVFKEARKKDHYAIQVVEEFTRNLSMAVISLITVFDPELIVLGGGVSNNADLFRDRIIELCSPVVQHMPRLEISALGVDAGIMGAIAYTLHNTSDELLHK